MLKGVAVIVIRNVNSKVSFNTSCVTFDKSLNLSVSISSFVQYSNIPRGAVSTIWVKGMKCLRVVFGTLYVTTSQFLLCQPPPPLPPPRPLAVEGNQEGCDRQVNFHSSLCRLISKCSPFICSWKSIHKNNVFNKKTHFLSYQLLQVQPVNFPFYFLSLQQCLHSLSLSIISYLTLNPLVPSPNLSYVFPFLLIVPTFSISGVDHHLFTSFSALNALHLLVPSLSHPRLTPPASWVRNHPYSIRSEFCWLAFMTLLS